MAGGSDESAQSARRWRVPDEEDHIFEWACRRLLTEAETKARRLRRLNAKQLRLRIEQSEWEAARVAKLKRKQDRVFRHLQGYIVIFDYSSSSDGSDGFDMDPPPAADSYSCASDRKGKGPARKC